MIDKTRLRELANLKAPGPVVLSVYLNLDPSEFATGRKRSTEVRSLMDELEKGLRNDERISGEQHKMLRRDVQRTRDFFNGDFSAKGAHGVVVFCSESLDLFEVIKLQRSVNNEAVVDDSPFIEPLLAHPEDDGYSVLAVNRKTARVLMGGAEQLREVLTIKDQVHRWHGKGGWSQARFQRSIEKETHDHLKKAADVVFTLYKRGQIQRLVICSTSELKSEVEKTLHPYLRERTACVLDLDLEHATVKEITAAVRPAITDDEQQREREGLDRLQAAVGSGGRGVTGLSDTLGTLNEKRVDVLMIQSGFRESGSVCHECGYLMSTNGSCPLDGSKLVLQDDIIESAVESALGQSAEIMFVRHHDDMEQMGFVGAVLRY